MNEGLNNNSEQIDLEEKLKRIFKESIEGKNLNMTEFQRGSGTVILAMVDAGWLSLDALVEIKKTMRECLASEKIRNSEFGKLVEREYDILWPGGLKTND